jgi:hypothetical protein
MSILCELGLTHRVGADVISLSGCSNHIGRRHDSNRQGESRCEAKHLLYISKVDVVKPRTRLIERECSFGNNGPLGGLRQKEQKKETNQIQTIKRSIMCAMTEYDIVCKNGKTFSAPTLFCIVFLWIRQLPSISIGCCVLG